MHKHAVGRMGRCRLKPLVHFRRTRRHLYKRRIGSRQTIRISVGYCQRIDVSLKTLATFSRRLPGATDQRTSGVVARWIVPNYHAGTAPFLSLTFGQQIFLQQTLQQFTNRRSTDPPTYLINHKCGRCRKMRSGSTSARRTVVFSFQLSSTSVKCTM